VNDKFCEKFKNLLAGLKTSIYTFMKLLKGMLFRLDSLLPLVVCG